MEFKPQKPLELHCVIQECLIGGDIDVGFAYL